MPEIRNLAIDNTDFDLKMAAVVAGSHRNKVAVERSQPLVEQSAVQNFCFSLFWIRTQHRIL